MPDILPSLISFASVVIGWFLVHRLAVSREQQAEWRNFSRVLADEIEKIENLALTYHKNANRDFALEEELLKRLDRAEEKLGILSSHLTSLENSWCIRNLANAITLKNFQTAHHMSKGADSQIYREIIVATSHVLYQLYNAH